MKKNCWEFKNCGREEGGAKVQELGVCSAALENSLNHVHGGKNAGRACWVVAGTLCNGEVQGSFVNKTQGCLQCDFFQMVSREEIGNMTSPINLLKVIEQRV